MDAGQGQENGHVDGGYWHVGVGLGHGGVEQGQGAGGLRQGHAGQREGEEPRQHSGGQKLARQQPVEGKVEPTNM